MGRWGGVYGHRSTRSSLTQRRVVAVLDNEQTSRLAENESLGARAGWPLAASGYPWLSGTNPPPPGFEVQQVSGGPLASQH